MTSWARSCAELGHRPATRSATKSAAATTPSIPTRRGTRSRSPQRRLGHQSRRYSDRYTNPPEDIAAGYIEVHTRFAVRGELKRRGGLGGIIHEYEHAA
jgi:hypothetical protein